MVRVYCTQCGVSAVAETAEEAWQKIPHEGHLHTAEKEDFEQAETCGHAEVCL